VLRNAGMYGMMCALGAEAMAELRTMSDAAFTARVFGGGSAPSLMEDHERTLHLETLWAAVDFVLTGATLDERALSPLDFLRPGGAGEPVGPDLGPGRARLLSLEQVRVLAHAIDALPQATVEARLTSPRLGHVYPFAAPEPGDAALLAAAARAVAPPDGGRDPSLTAQALVAKLKPSRGPRPTASERGDVHEALVELRAFLAKVVRDGAGALISVA
jgi:hypothetical protein